MSSPIQIPGNVWEFIDRASDDIGKIEAAHFSQDMHSEIVEGRCIASPIEQVFLVALHVMARARSETIDPEPMERPEGTFLGWGVHVTEQFQVDQYRVDFLVERVWFYDGANRRDQVLVELDGHEFHDKDKRQRSYEKARDRHLARRGFKVLHYTGSDVLADPYKVAYEVMDTIECFGPVGMEPYDKKNPLGIC